MEAAAGVSAVSRSGSLSVPSSSRKEWRAVSEQHHSVRNVGDDTKLEQSKMEQLDERTIYEHGREPVDVDFCSITVDRSSDDDILQQQIHGIARKREELQQLETELRAQMIARSEIIQVQNNFNAQIKEREDTVTKLQEQLRQTGQSIHDLERRIEEKDRELHAIKLDNEAAWAKQDILREQNKELATFRRERDHSEAERVQHIQQIRELQEHIQEKDRQVLELQEQHRADQEAIFVKDEQLKAWIARVQELDAMQSTTNHSLQAELRERTEQYNQLWLGCHRQFVEMERLHLHTVQQLQLELAELRERNGSYPDNLSQTNSKDIEKFVQNNGNQLDLTGNDPSNANNGALPNGNVDDDSSFASTGNASNKADHFAGVPVAPSLIGMPTYLPPGQLATLHPFILHQQGIPQSMASHAPQAHAGHFHSGPGLSSLPQWQNQQAVPENSQISTQNQVSSSQAGHSLMNSEGKYDYEVSVNGHGYRPDFLDAHISPVSGPESTVSSSAREPQVIDSIDKGYIVASQPDQSLHPVSSQLNEPLRLSQVEQNTEIKDQTVASLNNQGLDDHQVLTEEPPNSAGDSSLSEASIHSLNPKETTFNNGISVVSSEPLGSAGHTDITSSGKMSENSLLDEKSLLACIVRTIPAGGRIRINSTLPNRLGKMLSPLHWHDYKKAYGKLDDFVASHPELFLIEGDYIQLREGAQQMISATAAVAKVAAAAASSPYSSFLPSMAVTPMAQSNRLKKIPSMAIKHPNGVARGISNVKILSKSKESQEHNGSSDSDRSSVTSSQSKGSVHGMSNSNYGKQQARTSGNALNSRR